MTDTPALPTIPLVVRRDPTKGVYSIKLGDLELNMLIAAEGGLNIEFENLPFVEHEPTITLRFVPGATELDLDTDLIAYLRERDAREVQG